MAKESIHPKNKIPVTILGATGSVGQKFIELLTNHPWFEIASLGASEKSQGKPFSDAADWQMKTPLPERIGNLTVNPCEPQFAEEIVFSALDSSVAGEVESEMAEAGHMVISNAKNHRMDSDVPLIVPEINPDHLELLSHQKYDGAIITNPNCSTIGLVMALKPLYDSFGLEAVNVVTLQALSGAGFPGAASLDIKDNVIPFIGGEEEKIETEPLKIFGNVENGQITEPDLPISAQCNRVGVTDGHLECVSVKLKTVPSKSEIINCLTSFKGEPQNLDMPFAPDSPIHYFEEENFPQPKLHRNLENGMAVSVGRLRECPVLDCRFIVLSHNTVRGAAGAAILNAELAIAKGYFDLKT